MRSGWKTFTGVVILQILEVLEKSAPGITEVVGPHTDAIVTGIGAIFVFVGLLDKLWKAWKKRKAVDAPAPN